MVNNTQGTEGGFVEEPRVHPSVGDDVVTLDGEPIGRVVAVYDRMFKIQGANAYQLLALESVYTRSMTRTTLVCNRSGLSQYVLDSASG